MRILTAAVLSATLLPAAALAQSAGRSVLLPPNPIDRATASTDQRAADARRAADADRLNASLAQRDADAKSGPIPQSTMTDSVNGFSTSQEIGSPVAPSTPPRS